MPGKKNLRKIAYESILDNILSGTLKQGERLYTSDIAKDLSISPTPVREALLQLCQEKLMTSDKRSGFIVRRMKLSDLKEYIFFRKILELTSADLIIQNITDIEITEIETILQKSEETYKKNELNEHRRLQLEFHTKLWKATKSNLYCDLLHCMNHVFVQTIVFSTSTKDIIETSISEHRRILECIKAKDTESLKDLIAKHIEGAKEHCTPYFSMF
jgi:DNA-binding GntR family transcriptional regulator